MTCRHALRCFGTKKKPPRLTLGGVDSFAEINRLHVLKVLLETPALVVPSSPLGY